MALLTTIFIPNPISPQIPKFCITVISFFCLKVTVPVIIDALVLQTFFMQLGFALKHTQIPDKILANTYVVVHTTRHLLNHFMVCSHTHTHQKQYQLLQS